MEFLAHRRGVPDRDGGFDDHRRIRIALRDQPDNLLHRRRLEALGNIIVIRRDGNDDEVRIGIGGLGIERRAQLQGRVRQNLLHHVIPHRRLAAIDHADFFRHNIHHCHLMMLGQQHRHRHADVACASNRNLVGSHAVPPIVSFLKKSSSCKHCGEPSADGYIPIKRFNYTMQAVIWQVNLDKFCGKCSFVNSFFLLYIAECGNVHCLLHARVPSKVTSYA